MNKPISNNRDLLIAITGVLSSWYFLLNGYSLANVAIVIWCIGLGIELYGRIGNGR